ncbi:hypothetical protein OU415_06760 [Saccharopolyspora sp. WRP15-2]|uniref:Uncharacterized protein n=1 Tax=Saccharopolyspora oryzae TaxID=2997343 RepID=A0ABT4UU94_9PSEU|nr:hypothetical protein [Saccharopolyspora oryzae]MDA3625128.1 hypothetical protein [Saccharopolyspora oryzae]
MAASRRAGPASARAVHRALAELGAAPIADPVARPHGPRPRDAALLLGVLAAKIDLDASVRADPNDDPPDGFTDFLMGYHNLIGDVQGGDTRLRLLALRSVRTAFDLTMAGENDPLECMASDAAMLTANLINAYRLQQRTANDPALSSILDSAGHFLHDLTCALDDYRGSQAAGLG